MALFLVGSLTFAWELAEYLGDRVLDTSLVPNRRDSTLDILWGLGAGTATIALVRALELRRRERTE
jgi:hypothetical protein